MVKPEQVRGAHVHGVSQGGLRGRGSLSLIFSKGTEIGGSACIIPALTNTKPPQHTNNLRCAFLRKPQDVRTFTSLQSLTDWVPGLACFCYVGIYQLP